MAIHTIPSAQTLADEALEKYVRNLDDFINDTPAAKQALLEHAVRLDRWAKVQSQRHDAASQISAPQEIKRKIQSNADLVIHMVHAAEAAIHESPDFVYNMIAESCKKARRAIGGDYDVQSATEAVKRHVGIARFAESRTETGQLFSPMEAWFKTGNEHVIYMPGREERMFNSVLMPQDISRSKWDFMLKFANFAYDFGLENHGNQEMMLLSRMLERLSKHERGSSNPHIPSSCKLKHNPASHSIYVCILAKKIFDAAGRAIEDDPNMVNGGRQNALEYLRGMRQEMAFGLLLHDMGEMEGELREGIEDAGKKDPKITKAKGRIEDSVFRQHLDGIAIGDDKEGKLFKAKVWLGYNGKRGVRDTFIDAYEKIEDKSTFFGRLAKTLDRMQSQQDYLRFQRTSKEQDFPTLAEPPYLRSELGKIPADEVAKKTEANKDFSLNYVSAVFRGAKAYEEEGPESLSSKASHAGDKMQAYVHAKIVEAVTIEYNHLMDQLYRAYRTPKPRILCAAIARRKGVEEPSGGQGNNPPSAHR